MFISGRSNIRNQYLSVPNAFQAWLTTLLVHLPYLIHFRMELSLTPYFLPTSQYPNLTTSLNNTSIELIPIGLAEN